MRRPQSKCKDCMRDQCREQQATLRKTAKGRRKLRTRWRRKERAMRRDPERAQTRNAYDREYYRTRRSLNPTPSLWLENRGDVTVEAAPVLAAFQASGLTIAEVAHRIGRDWKTINKWLRADRMRATDAALILDTVGSSPVEVGL